MLRVRIDIPEADNVFDCPEILNDEVENAAFALISDLCKAVGEFTEFANRAVPDNVLRSAPVFLVEADSVERDLVNKLLRGLDVVIPVPFLRIFHFQPSFAMITLQLLRCLFYL